MHLVFVIQDCSSSAFEMDCTAISSFTLFRARALSSSSWSFKWRYGGCEQQEHCGGCFEEARNFWHPHLAKFRIFEQLPYCVNSSSSGLTWKCLWQSQDPQANGFLDKASNCWHPHISPLTTFLHSDQPIELKHLEHQRNKLGCETHVNHLYQSVITFTKVNQSINKYPRRNLYMTIT